jgi:hypothetical protein
VIPDSPNYSSALPTVEHLLQACISNSIVGSQICDLISPTPTSQLVLSNSLHSACFAYPDDYIPYSANFFNRSAVVDCPSEMAF